MAGRTDPHALAQHRNYRCHASEAEIIAALTGNYRLEHVFVLRQNLEAFDYVQQQLAVCDTAIEAHLQTLMAQAPPPTTSLPPRRPRQKPRDNEPRFELRVPLHHLTGVDLSQLDGIGPYNALRLLSEIGTDMTRWPTDKHFTSWLTLAPKNKISGGRLLSSRTQPSANRAAAILRLAAMNLGRTQTALGAFYRRLAFRVGRPKPSRPPPGSSPSSSTAPSKTGSCIGILAPTRTKRSIARTSCVASASARPTWDLGSSTSRPAKSSRRQFLRRRLSVV